MGDSDQINSTITDVVRDCLVGGRVAAVNTAWDEDYEGDHFLSVKVVLEDRLSAFDKASLSSLARHIRGALVARNVTALPVLRFMTVAEARELAL